MGFSDLSARPRRPVVALTCHRRSCCASTASSSVLLRPSAGEVLEQEAAEQREAQRPLDYHVQKEQQDEGRGAGSDQSLALAPVEEDEDERRRAVGKAQREDAA